MRLKGKTIAITGGAGGIGFALAQDCAREGAEVIVIDRSGSRTREAAVGIAGLPVEVDLVNECAVRDAFRSVPALDGLVVAAGIQLHGEDGPIADVTSEVWQRTIDVNLTGTFLTCKYAVPKLLKRPASSIVLIGSPTGLTMSGASYAAYSASKAGMMALSRIIAADYAADGLRANVLIPGTTVTPLIATLTADVDTAAKLRAGTPIGRLGTPADFVGIVRWLLSDESSFATGASFAVDGGLTAR